MIKNTSISLEPNSKVREEAKNIIKYTLLLDYKQVEAALDEPGYVNKIKVSVQDCCKGLYTAYATKLDFFGTPGENYSSEGKLVFLSALDFNDLTKPASITGMILNNCVMSCYHALLTEYLSDTTLTSYNLMNYWGSRASFASFIKKETSDNNLEETMVSEEEVADDSICKDIQSNKNAQIDQFYANQVITSPSDFITNMRNKSKIIENNFPFLFSCEENIKDVYHSKVQFMSVCKTINNVTKANLQLWSGNQRRKSSSSYASALISLIEQTTPWLYELESGKKEGKAKELEEVKEKEDRKDIDPEEMDTGNNGPSKKEVKKLFAGLNDTDIVGLVYHYYTMEKMMNVNVLYSLLRNIVVKEKDKRYLLRGTNILNILSKISVLPNVFSRTYFMRYAFDHMDAEVASYLDFWNTHDFAKRGIVFRETLDPNGFHSSHWLLQYEMMVNYMAYIIPIYDWCFVNMFLEGIESKNSSLSYRERLKLGISILEEYIANNAEDIMRPILLDNMDGVDLCSKKVEDELTYKISTKEYEQLFSKMIQERDIELNVQPLTVEKFRGNHLKTLHDFYIEKLVFTRRTGE